MGRKNVLLTRENLRQNQAQVGAAIYWDLLVVMRGRKLDCKVLKTELKDMLHINSANKNICTLVPSVPNMNSFQSPVIIRIMLIIIKAEGEKQSQRIMIGEKESFVWQQMEKHLLSPVQRCDVKAGCY